MHPRHALAPLCDIEGKPTIITYVHTYAHKQHKPHNRINRTSRETEAQMTTHTPQSHTSSTQTHTSQETKTTLLAPLKNPIYRRLFTAHVLALTATGLLNVGLGLLAFDIAGDRAGAVVSMALTIKILIYVCAGPWLSAFFARFPVKAVLVGSDVIRIAVGCSLPFITSEAQVYVAVAVLQMAAATFTPTFQALIPRIINNPNEYTSALSLSRIAYDLEQILSPVLAAMLLSFASRGQVFAVAAVGFVGSATMVAGSGSLGVDKRESVSRRVREGMVMMLRLPELRGVLALNLALAAPTALVLVNTVVLVRGQLGRSESDVAVLLGACGAGSIVMALLIPHLRLHVSLFGGAGGVTGVLLLAESHISIHTWPEYGFAAVDVFLCGRMPSENARRVLEKALGAERAEWRNIPRGNAASVAVSPLSDGPPTEKAV